MPGPELDCGRQKNVKGGRQIPFQRPPFGFARARLWRNGHTVPYQFTEIFQSSLRKGVAGGARRFWLRQGVAMEWIDIHD